VKGMMKNWRLSATMADVAWHGLLAKVEDKLKRHGAQVVEIDRCLPSSNRCSCCGTIDQELSLRIENGSAWCMNYSNQVAERLDGVSQGTNPGAVSS